MYYLLHWPTYLNENLNSESVKNIISSLDREFFALINHSNVVIYHYKTYCKILTYTRSQESIRHYGSTIALEWKCDNSLIALGTDGGFVLLLSIQGDSQAVNHQTVLNRRENGAPFSTTWNGKQDIPSLSATLIDVMDFEHPITCLGSFRDDILVCTKDGSIHRLKWNGGILYTQKLNLKQIPFYYDLEHSRASRIGEECTYCRCIEWCPTLGGLLILLSNGRAALLNIPTSKLDVNQVEGVWAEHLKHGTCMAANMRFRGVAFGIKGGEGIFYIMDDVTGALKIQHRLRISSREYPDAATVTGSVVKMRWSPDGCVLAMVWERAGFCLWSVFGSLLFSTLGEKVGLGRKISLSQADWGPEGYSLVGVIRIVQETDSQRRHLVAFDFAKSSLTVNPFMHNHEHLILQSSDSLYISEREEMDTGRQWHVATLPSIYLNSNWPIRYVAICDSGKHVVIAGKCGIAIYTLSNRRWKVFGNETQEKDMHVVGGLAWWREFVCLSCINLVDNRDELRLYPITSKLDNAFCHSVRIQSQAVMLNSFRDILIVLCADAHINLYSLHSHPNKTPSISIIKLQEVPVLSFIPYPICVVSLTLTSLRSEINVSRHQTPSVEAESMLVNYAGRLLMFQRDRSGVPVQDPHGFHHGNAYTRSSNSVVTDNAVNKIRPLPFCAPFVVASSVELMWTTWRDSPDKKYLTDSLWLNCGLQGMKVWLPLLTRDTRTPGFMSKRIMLPFEVDIYPLVVLFEEALLIGPVNDFTQIHSTSASCATTEGVSAFAIMPYAVVEKASQIYLHHIVKQLLRKNLGVHALELSLCCRELSYFHHALELLLHEVLEEEATSKEPIPDPLLPRVVAFIQEFPEFMDTVAHCARKTEVALWNCLFATVGNPKDLFESCLLAGQLDTAASYLIILQNTEKPLMSKQHATLLLDAALEQSKWNLVKDLMRFLKTIDPKDFSSTEHSTVMSGNSGTAGVGGAASSTHRPPLQKRSSARLFGQTPPVSPVTLVAADAGPLVVGGPALKMRHGSVEDGAPPTQGTPVTPASSGMRRHNSQPNQLIGGSSCPQTASATNTPQQGAGGTSGMPTAPAAVSPTGPCPAAGQQPGTGAPGICPGATFGDEVDALLNRHARKLLAAYKLSDLARFAANTQFHNHQFIAWLTKERHKSAQIDSYVGALKRLHADFRWPLPIFIPRVPPPSSKSDPELTLLAMGGVKSVNGGNGAHLTLNSLRLRDVGLVRAESEEAVCDEVMLRPPSRALPGGARPIRSPGSELTSECSSLAGGGSSDPEGTRSMASLASGLEEDSRYLHDLELMTQELANKGPEEAQVQLRYLYHIFFEASCLEWCTVISVLLREPISFVHVMDACTLLADQSAVANEARRIAQGLEELENWSETECLGYKSFLLAIRPHVSAMLEACPEEAVTSNVTRRASHVSSGSSRPASLDMSLRGKEMRAALRLNTGDSASSPPSAVQSAPPTTLHEEPSVGTKMTPTSTSPITDNDVTDDVEKMYLEGDVQEADSLDDLDTSGSALLSSKSANDLTPKQSINIASPDTEGNPSTGCVIC